MQSILSADNTQKGLLSPAGNSYSKLFFFSFLSNERQICKADPFSPRATISREREGEVEGEGEVEAGESLFLPLQCLN